MMVDTMKRNLYTKIRKLIYWFIQSYIRLLEHCGIQQKSKRRAEYKLWNKQNILERSAWI